MSYRIYTTDTFVISAKSTKDADISLLLFTADFGLIYAIAKSARLSKSKLKYSIQSLSFGKVSLVKGREVWRITGAKTAISLYDKRLPLEARMFFARALGHIERFCPREQIELPIFEITKAFAGHIFKNPTTDLEALDRLENIFLLKMLFELGYIEKKDEIQPLVEKSIADIWATLGFDAKESIDEHARIDSIVKKAIDKAIAVSQL